MKMNNILVIGAHYDDAELAVGGSMAKWVKEGKIVYKLTLTDNDTNFYKKDIIVKSEESKKESAQACKVLGVNEILNFEVQKCTELMFSKSQMQQVESFIIDNNIDTIILHNLHDIQQDHVHASTISYVAGRYCNNILMYQSNQYVLPEDYYPRVFVDISDTIELKKQALSCYCEEHDRFGKLFDMTISLNEIYGYKMSMSSQKKYAEAFSLIKMEI